MVSDECNHPLTTDDTLLDTCIAMNIITSTSIILITKNNPFSYLEPYEAMIHVYGRGQLIKLTFRVWLVN